MRAANQRREARIKGARINDFSAADWLVVLDEFNHACAYCLRQDVPLQREHMQPLAKGGDHTKSNIVPACGECNRRKHTKTLLQTLAS